MTLPDQVHISERTIRGSIRESLSKIHTDPIWAYPEGVLNAFTAMRHLDPHKRVVAITLKAGAVLADSYIIGEGTGITNYAYLRDNMGYDNTEEYIRDLKDPNYMNKMGLGIPSIASLSLEGEAEFRSVFINKKNQEEGLVATYTVKEGRPEGWIIPEEHPAPNYIFTAYACNIPIKTGCWVIVKNSRQYTLEEVRRLLSSLFSRKLNAGYRIILKDSSKDGDFTEVRPMPGFCCKHESTFGYVHHPNKKLGDFRVYGDLHSVDKVEGAQVFVLYKQMKIGYWPNEYMCNGYVDCDTLEFKPDREGIRMDKNSSVYNQFNELVIKQCIKERFDKKPIKGLKSLKIEKKWADRFKSLFQKYYLKNSWHDLIRVNSILEPSGPQIGSGSNRHGSGVQNKPKVIKVIKRCPDGFHWDKKIDECVPNTEPNHGTVKPTGTGIEHEKKDKKIRKRPRPVIPEQAIPDLGVVKQASPDKFYVWIDVTNSTIVFNTYHAWVRDHIDSASDETIDLLLTIALLNVVPQNQNLGSDQFLKRVTEEL